MAEKIDRLTRVNELLKRELAELIERNLTVPSGMLVSVTEVNVSVDLRNATVYISIFGGKASDRQAIMHELGEERHGFQSSIGRTLAFKRTPVLDFRLDTRTAKGDRGLGLLQKPGKEDSGHDEQ
ncbi:Ribosome-binding factor A [bioreactor metagenome]|uniref:Ribosome-binding factor A n=1 Tax=bioreactor metagenome TaxID=1076179 RepID=A0A645HGW9_9ZZZZ